MVQSWLILLIMVIVVAGLAHGLLRRAWHQTVLIIFLSFFFINLAILGCLLLVGLISQCLPMLNYTTSIIFFLVLFIAFFAATAFTVLLKISETSGISFVRLFSFATACMICILIGDFLFVGTSAPESRYQARNGVCISNLKQIGLAYSLYRNDFSGKFPGGFAYIYPQYIRDKNCFVCPCAHPGREYREKYVFSEDTADYILLKGLSESSPPRTILVQDRQPHVGGEINVVYVDGHVGSVNTIPWYKRIFIRIRSVPVDD